jgi:MFS family permease
LKVSEKTAYKAVPLIAPYAWVILVVVYLASVAAPLNQSKVPPILPVLMGAFQLKLADAGLLMSVFAITGLLLALPAGVILQRLGLKLSGLIALACLAAGSALGAVSSHVLMFLASRVIEGTGMGLLGVLAPTAIAMWFPREKQGAPMGIWATWVPVATLAMYILAPTLATNSGWQIVWWIACGYTLVAMLAYGPLMRAPSPSERSIGFPSDGQNQKTAFAVQSGLRAALANRNIWLLALEFACFNTIFTALGTFYPTFLTEIHAYPLAQAAWISSIGTIFVLVSAPAAGWLSDRIGSRRLVFTLPMLGIAAALLLPFRVTGWQILALQAIFGLLAGAVATAIFAAAPEVMANPGLAGLALGVIMLGQNLGVLVGPVWFGQMVKTSGWVAAGDLLIPVCLLGMLAGWMVKIR